jgi:hypothetical protein
VDAKARLAVAAPVRRDYRRNEEVHHVRGVPSLLACLIATALPLAGAGAESVTAPLQVSARVLPHVRLDPLAPVSTRLTVTASDVRRGYVDVAHRYALRTNARDRVRLQFRPLASYARVTIEGLGSSVPLADEPVEVYPLPGREVAFQVRLWLGPDLGPGDYPAPVQVLAVVD